MRALQRSDLQWVTERPVTERLRLSARAWLDHSHGPLQATSRCATTPNCRRATTRARSPGRWPCSAAPTSPTPRRSSSRRPCCRTSRRGFTYTLTPGEYGDEDGRHAIDEFWLDRREGFCEHFSAAFVVIMRALDVPARIVTGYQGADPVLQDG